MANLRSIDYSIERLFETQAKAHQLLAVLASRQRWPEELCRWLLMAALAPLYALGAFKTNPRVVSRSTTASVLGEVATRGDFVRLGSMLSKKGPSWLPHLAEMSRELVFAAILI